MIEKRLFQFARDADVNRRGGLDNPALIMKRMPEDLKDVRKITIGRHRVYFTGHNTQCSYKAIYVKLFKKTGVDDEDDPKHQKQLIKASLDEDLEEIKDPDAQDDSEDFGCN